MIGHLTSDKLQAANASLATEKMPSPSEQLKNVREHLTDTLLMLREVHDHLCDSPAVVSNSEPKQSIAPTGVFSTIEYETQNINIISYTMRDLIERISKRS